MTGTVAAIVAHPDDEVLACGGALAAHAAAGHRVRILLLSTGLISRGEVSAAEIEKLQGEARQAAEVLGAEEVEFADFPDNAMDSVRLLEVVKRVEGFLKNFPAEVVYTHHGGDLNIDHRVVQQAVLTACRPLPGRGPLEILACEVNSATEWAASPAPPFVPTEFLDISATLDVKVRALECYRGELRAWPHPRSLEGVRALARWRGAQAGFEAAEAFMTLRRIRPAIVASTEA